MSISSNDFELALSNFVKYVEGNVDCEPFVKRIRSWAENATSVGDSILTVHSFVSPTHPLHGGDLKMLLGLVCAKFAYEPEPEVTEKLLKHLRLLQIVSDELIEQACADERAKNED